MGKVATRCSGDIAHRIVAVQFAILYDTPLFWEQDYRFQASYHDIFDNKLEIITGFPYQKKGMMHQAIFPVGDYSDILIKPSLLCRAEEIAYSMELGDYMGVELKSEHVTDNSMPLYLYTRFRDDVVAARKKWQTRPLVYYLKKVWGCHKLQGVQEEVINFLLFSMCGEINTSTYNGLFAKRFGYGC